MRPFSRHPRAAYGPASPVEPSVAWTAKLDTDAGHYTVDGSHRVTQWTDQSGNGHHFAPDVAADGPVDNVDTSPSSLTAFTFDGSSKFLEGPAKSALIAAAAFTLFVVVRVDAAPLNNADSWANNTIVGDTDGYLELAAKNTTTLYAANYSTADDHANTTIASATWYVVEMRHQSGTLYLRINGSTEVNVASGDTGSLVTNLRVGRGLTSDYCQMACACVRIIDSAMTLSDRDAEVAFLKAKYGIA